MITCSSYGSVPRVYANTNFYQIREIESLSEQVLYQKVPYGTRYQDLEMPDSIDVFVSGGQTEDVPDAGSDENVAAFANRINDDAVLEKTDSEENGEKEDTEGKDAGENSKDKSEGGEGLEKAESGSGEQGDSGKDGNSAENGDSQDENANPGNGESDEKDDSGKTDSGSSGGNVELNEDGSSSNGKTDQPKEDVKTDEKTEEEIDEKEGFWRKVKVRWVLDAEESQASRYDGENPGIYLFRAELKSSNYEVDEDELPVIQITVLEEEQLKTTLEFAPLEESIADQILPLGSKESDIRFPETLTVRETMGEETTERTLSGITWKLDAENSDYSEFQGGLAPEDYFDRFDEDGEPEETEEKTWEGYDKANEEYKGAIYTYIPVIPESEEIPEDTALPEIHVQVGDAGIALYADEGITGEGTETNPYVIRTAEQWSKVMGKKQRNQYNGNQPFGVSKYIKLGADIDLSGQSWESRTLTTCLDGDGYALSGISQPLFSVLNGTVKNLILSDVRIEGTGNQGAIAQTVGNENKATIEKCYVSGSITATGSNNSGVGGLIGAAQNAQGAPLTIENCVVNADITGKGSSLAGGLIGSVSNSDVVTIKKCIAMGTVSTVEDKGSGGLVGGPGRSVTIKNSAALQEEVSTKSSKYFVDRIFGYDGDYKVHVVGEQNFAYQGMKVKYGDKLLDKPKDELENYGVSVSKTNLLTTNFWKNTIGWGSAAENWEFADKQLPTLKMKRGNDEVKIFSGTDIPDYLQATNSLSGSVKSGETGIGGAEITFKKDSSEKKVATETKTIEINLSIAAKYAITFASDRQDSQGEAPTLENAAARTVITLPENTFKVYGMNFGGWSDGTKTYASGASYTMPEGNVTFKAVWVQDQWDGQAVVEPAKDENGYYQISTGAELAYFRDTKISNWKAKLMCDIDMGGHDFASIPKAGAEFDGCGHTIRGLNAVGKAYVGLFQAISSNCEIKNLTIENAVVKASNDDARVGILVGDVYDSLTVENCYVSGTIETTDGTNQIEAAGGLIGNVREKYSVEIQSCYADAEIKGTASKRFVGGLVGWTGGTTTIDNSYAVVDMDVDKGDYIGGLVGSGNVTISHSYAAGEALTKNPTGASVAGISDNGSISSCVSIFPEMRSLNRIGGTSGEYTNNYGFAGTVARKSDGTILTPDPNMMGADKLYGADATEANLKDPEFYKGLGWDFASTWTMDSTDRYAFPILKKQTLSPNLTLDLKPSVTGITLDKTNETIYPRGSVQLTATVDVANGASREVTWKSSDPAVKVEDGLVTAAAAANGTYTITAISKADPSKWAECQLTVDTAEHMVTVGREPGHTNSLNAVVKAYASLNDVKGGTNPISTTGSETGTFTFSQKAGEIVYLAFTGLDSEDVVSKVTITDANGSKVNATICNLENPTVYCFTMPCSNASVQVSYAENMNAYQYTWFVGQEWGTWGTTAAFETKEWSGGDHIGSLKVTKIINGKLFREFKIKSMSLYKKDSVIPKKVNSQSELTENGNYCIEKDNTTGLPTLYVYLEGPGMVAVDIEVQDNPNAEFSITKKPGSSSYYMLNRTTAKVGDLVTATLTDEGVRRMKEMQNKNACLTYSGGLLVVIYPPKFTESGGKWTASFNMPAQNIETNVYFGEKDKVTLKGTDKEVDYDGAPKSVEDGIRATIGGQDLSEQFQGQYEVHYEGVNGTVYSSMTPPTNAGTYSCKIKIPDSNVYYRSDPITVQLTIKKIATKTPKAAQAAAWTDTSVTLEAPSAFVDGTAIPAGYELEYCVDQGEWQDSPVFTGLTPETTYKFYVRLKEGVNTTASAASEAVTVQTKKASSDPSNPTKPNPSNPNPSTPGNPQGTTTSGRDRNTSTWVKESTGWRYRLSNGTYLSGSLVLDPATGRQVEQVVWKQLRGAWWAFGADGYIRTGWVYDYSAGKWYYVDENTGMRTGWYLDPQDGRWYYLDPATGEMLTEWQLIPDLGYVYLNPYAPQPTWAYDEALKTWVYMEGAGRPYGSLYMAEWTPDGYYVNADGVWEPAR